MFCSEVRMKEDSTIVLGVYAALTALLLLIGCGGNEPQVEEPEREQIDFELVGRGRNAQLADTTELRITSAQEWESYQDSLTALGELSEVDFDERDVLLVAVPVTSGGYDLTINSIERVGDEVRVEYVLDEPGEDCLTAQVLLTPFVAVAADIGGEGVQFVRTRSSYSCGVRER